MSQTWHFISISNEIQPSFKFRQEREIFCCIDPVEAAQEFEKLKKVFTFPCVLTMSYKITEDPVFLEDNYQYYLEIEEDYLKQKAEYIKQKGTDPNPAVNEQGETDKLFPTIPAFYEISPWEEVRVLEEVTLNSLEDLTLLPVKSFAKKDVSYPYPKDRVFKRKKKSAA